MSAPAVDRSRLGLDPRPVVEPLMFPDGRALTVVRDDLVPGGTKSTVAEVLWDGGYDEVVFPSPCEGFAQIALGVVATRTGKRATCFVAKRKVQHPNVERARKAGTRIIEVPHGRYSVVRARAREYVEMATRFGDPDHAGDGWRAHLVPLGIAGPGLEEAMTRRGRAVYRQLPALPSEVWVCVGSGALCRSLRAAFPGVPFHAVQVGHKVTAEDVAGATVHVAPEPFGQVARRPPPWPSAPNYDAKLWQFVERLAQPGALIWNVAA
jgi:hypothetical protein